MHADRPSLPPKLKAKALKGQASLKDSIGRLQANPSVAPATSLDDLDLTHLSGTEVWNTPTLEHCKKLVDPRRLKTTTPVHIVANQGSDGRYHFKVNALAGCVPQDLFDAIDLDLPACKEGASPEHPSDLSKCEAVRMAHLQQIPKNLVPNERGEVEYYYFHKPASDRSEPSIENIDPVDPSTDNLAGATLQEATTLAHALILQRSDPAQSGAPLVVCADYEVFSRTLYENLRALRSDFPSLEIHWILRPHKHDATGLNLAYAGAAAASLGLSWEANNLLFDMSGATSLEDIAAAMSSLGIAPDHLLAKMKSKEIRQKVSNGIEWCEHQGMSNTPSMKYEGRLQIGTRTPQQIRTFLAG